MKHFTLCSVAAAALAMSTFNAAAQGTVDLLGVTYSLDTISHVKVGPGTTATHLALQSTVNVGQKLQVHYLTIDKSVPGVSMHAVCARDMVAGTEKTSSMAERKSTSSRLYFAGCNADFFTTSGNATNGTSKVGSPTTSCTADGEVYKTSNSNYQFSVDRDGVARIGRLNYYTGTAKCGSASALFKGINVGAPNNGVTIYTPRYWGSTNQTDYTGNSYEVTAKLVEGDSFTCGGTYRMQVTSEPNTSGDTKIPSDGFVIFARGNAKDFVAGLHTGDIVEFDHIVLLGDERIYPTQIVSGNPKTVGDGVRLDSEGERGDASAQHPRTGIGVSQDGNKIIMMVIEGRLNGSVGVRTSQLGDMMLYAGAYEAVNLDGGGSSTLYTSAFGVRNRCSDGSERAVGNAIFAAVDAPADDKEIAEIQFADWKASLPKFGTYTPVIYGYNKYGVLVSDNVTGFALECQPELGTITNGNTLLASGSKCGVLTAKLGECTASILGNIADTVDYAPRIPNLLIDSHREYLAEVQADNGLTTIAVDPVVFNWSSSDANVVTVSDHGLIKGVADGEATITGTIGDKTVTINVTVQVPVEARYNLFKNFSESDWKIALAGTKAEITPTEDGLAIDYTITSTRTNTITFTYNKDLFFWSLPIAIAYDVTPTAGQLRSVNVKFADSLGNRYSLASDAIATGVHAEGSFDLNEYINTSDLLNYPLRLTNIVYSPSGSMNDAGHLEIPGIYTVYDPEAVSGIEFVEADTFNPDPSAPVEYYNLQGIRIANPQAGQLYIVRQGHRAAKIVM
ncbi:MAG: phosphodiester glycosidase family protein [Muribaculaceae bacterium]|nr:phosphodiester glycosidase family protein [Muribaculaceae bacterium]